MFAEDTILADSWKQIKLVLSCNIEFSCVLLVEPDLQICTRLISIDKHFKPTYLYLCAQLGVLVNTRNLVLSIPCSKRQALVKILLTT